MKNLITLVIGAALLAGCTTSGDGRLSLSQLSIVLKTEYLVSGTTNTYVGCDSLIGAPVDEISGQTEVRVDFSSSGYVGSLQVRLRGVTDSSRDNSFVATFTRDNGLVQNGSSNDYSVFFTANAVTGNFLPASKEGGLSAQAIIVTPKRAKIKLVNVDPANRVNTNGAFVATLIGTSDQGSSTGEISSIGNVPVYSGCSYVSTTDTQL